MSYHIKIERIPYEEPYHIQLLWDVSNGSVSTRFEYYDNADSLKELAENLEQFPRHKDHVFLYEIGSEKPEDRFAYYFRFRVFTTDAKGSSAIQVRFSNNRGLPYREISNEPLAFWVHVEQDGKPWLNAEQLLPEAPRPVPHKGYPISCVESTTRRLSELRGTTLGSVSVGRPTQWSPEEYVMISTWEGERALREFAGEHWDQAVIPEGMEKYVKQCWVHHYEVFG